MPERPYYRGRPALAKRPLVAQTCRLCGLILGRKHYQKTNSGWTSVCNSCFSKRSRQNYVDPNDHAVDHEHQARTLDTATRKGYLWTLKELDIVVEALEAGFTYNEIAVLTDRTYYSIHQTVNRYSLKDGWPTREQWIISLP